jgi:hypothetical protein
MIQQVQAPLVQAPLVQAPLVQIQVQQNSEIRESDILRGFRMFNDLVNDEQHNSEDLQQERFYQAFENRSIINYENAGNEYGVHEDEEEDDNEEEDEDEDED